MSPTTTELIDLDLEDFRRLGVRPYECRLTVIRQAAARSAKALAERQLRAPSDQVGLQLSRVATSAYRLLDPRQRDDLNQRAYVGRILPSVLDGAGQTDFHSGSARRETDRDTPFMSDRMTDAQLIELLEVDSTPVGSGIQWTSSLSDEDLLSTTAFSRRLAKIRPQVGNPWIVTIFLAVALGSWAAIFHLRGETRPIVVERGDSIAGLDARPQPLADVDAQPLAPRERVGPSFSEGEPVTSPRASGPSAVESGLAQEERSAETESVDPPQTMAPPTAELGLSSPGPSLVDPVAAVVDPLAHSADLKVDSGPVGSPLPVDERKHPLDSASADPRAIAMSFPEVGGEARESGEFLPDPFAALAEAFSSQPDALTRSADTAPSTATPIPPTLSEATQANDSEANRSERSPTFDPPSSAAIKAARIEITMLIPELAEQILVTEAEQRIAQLESLCRTLEVGTADQYAANLMIAEAAWLIDNGQGVRNRMRVWIADYRIALEPPLASSYVRAIDHAATDETRRHLLKEGLVLADHLMVHESISACDDVVKGAERLGKTLADSESILLLDQFSEAITQMRRQAESTKRLITRTSSTPEEGPQSDDAGALSADAGIAGRYYCLMLRRWEIGLPWLAHTADLRVASVAGKEVELNQAATADELVDLGERWMACAARETGRTADSMNLHAIDLLERAKESVTGLRALSLERKIENIEALLPLYLVESVSRGDDDQLPAHSPDATPTPPAGPSSLGPSRITGRMTYEGRDLAVQLDYALGVVIRKDRLDEVLEQIGENLESATVDLSGEIRLPHSASITITTSQQVTRQRIWIADDLVTPEPGASTSTVVLEAGTHPIRWAFAPQAEESAFLRIDDSEGRPVVVFPSDSLGSLPLRTVLTVKVR